MKNININKKQRKVLKNHTIKTHSEGYNEGINVATSAGLGTGKCNICGFITFIRDIYKHIREEHEGYLKDGLLTKSVFCEEYCYDT